MNSMMYVKNPVRDDQIFVTWGIIMLEITLKGWIQRDGHGPQRYSGTLWCLNHAQLVLRDPKCAQKKTLTPLHHHYRHELLI